MESATVGGSAPYTPGAVGYDPRGVSMREILKVAAGVLLALLVWTGVQEFRATRDIEAAVQAIEDATPIVEKPTRPLPAGYRCEGSDLGVWKETRWQRVRYGKRAYHCDALGECWEVSPHLHCPPPPGRVRSR